MKKVSVSHVNNEHNTWLRGLDFYKNEIGFLRENLSEIAQKNTNQDVLKEVEHFENQFTLQQNKIDTLRHRIHSNLSNISSEARHAAAGYIDGALLAEHTALGEKYDTEEQIVGDLKHSFRKFAEQWM